MKFFFRIFEPVFSPVQAAAQVKNARVGLIENLKTASIKDKWMKI